MHTTRVKTWLRITGGGLSAVAVGVLAWSLFYPIDGPVEAEAQGATTSGLRKSERVALPTLKQFEPFLRRQLRRPLFDPPPKTVVASSSAAVPRPSPLGLRLLGTATEPGRSVAMLLTSRGAIEFRAVGQRLDDTPDGAEVISVDSDRAVLKYHGETISLELEGEKRR